MPHSESPQPVSITSQDFWVKIVDFLQQNWALIEPMPSGTCRVYFVTDVSGVFDQLDFPDVHAAEAALERNGFGRIEDNPEFDFLERPRPPYRRRAHPNGPIYSSGRYWR